MVPVLCKWLPLLDTPVDFGRTYKKKPLFGSHKTWRGIVTASLMGILVFYLQKELFRFPFFYDLSLIDYDHFPLLHGFLLGFGAIMGDLVKSFFKRRRNIPPGKPWWGYDQVDFVIGGFGFSFFLYVPDVIVFVVLLIVSPLLHVLFNYLGYRLGLTDHL
jgi:CDP-2,3-bis-(O-geranylgeranyl)-sn-glycerol synthase